MNTVLRWSLVVLILLMGLSPVGSLLAYAVAESKHRSIDPWDLWICTAMTFCWLPNRVIGRVATWVGV